MERIVPQYVYCSVPVPRASWVPWYKSTFPAYAGIFLWVGFYLKLAEPIGYASLSVCLWGLLLAGLLSFGLYYYIPAMLGMQTGCSLYAVGTSTFGTSGGYLIPGLLMGVLQVGWVAVIASISAHFIMSGLNQTSKGLFSLIVVVVGVWRGLGGSRGHSLCWPCCEVPELDSSLHDPVCFVGKQSGYCALQASATSAGEWPYERD